VAGVGNEDGNGVGYNVPRVRAKAAANVIHRKMVILHNFGKELPKQIFNYTLHIANTKIDIMYNCENRNGNYTLHIDQHENRYHVQL
jgi:hypothetical protein